MVLLTERSVDRCRRAEELQQETRWFAVVERFEHCSVVELGQWIDAWKDRRMKLNLLCPPTCTY